MSISNRAQVPGPKSHALMRRLRQVESRNVTYSSRDFPVFWKSARGCTVTDVDGRRYLDLTAAFGVSSLGHGAPVIARALERQARQLWHGMGDVHPTETKVELLEVLAALAPFKRAQVILSGSGSEAVESALKTTRLATGKSKVIAFSGAYHGLTLGTLAVGGRREFSTPFRSQLASLSIVIDFPDSVRGPSEDECWSRVRETLRRRAREIGAILVEPMQARGGIRIPSRAFLNGLRRLASEHGVLLIVDEIYTGLGRTGTRWAVERSRVIPDLLCAGKALANGYPISACLGRAALMRAWPPSDGEALHTSTFLGNPLGCAMASAALRALEQGHWSRRAAQVGSAWLADLRSALGDHPKVADIRGVGLMIGIELVKSRRLKTPDAALAGRVITESLRRGLIVLSAGEGRNVLALTPPLTISLSETQRATTILKEVLYAEAFR